MRRSRRGCSYRCHAKRTGRRHDRAGIEVPSASWTFWSTTLEPRTRTSPCSTSMRRCSTSLRGEREESLSCRHSRGPGLPQTGLRRDYQRRLHRGRASASRTNLVQRLQRRGDLLTKSMALELAPDRIRVNAVNPVMGETGCSRISFPRADTRESAPEGDQHHSPGASQPPPRHRQGMPPSLPATKRNLSPESVLKSTVAAAFNVCESR